MHDVIDVANRHAGLAERHRCLVVDLGDDDAGLRDRIGEIVHLDAEVVGAAVRREMRQHDVEPEPPVADNVRQRTIMHRQHVERAALLEPAVGAGATERAQAHAAGDLGRIERGGHADIGKADAGGKPLQRRGKLLHQADRLHRRAAPGDAIAFPDQLGEIDARG